jgi:hypothetical protein
MPSSVIAGIHYDAERRRLTVTFVTGRVFEYVDVPPNVARAFRSAFSKGTYFSAYIRDRYDHRELAREHS